MREIACYRLEFEVPTYEEAQALAIRGVQSGYGNYTIRALDADGVPLYTPDDESQEATE